MHYKDRRQGVSTNVLAVRDTQVALARHARISHRLTDGLDGIRPDWLFAKSFDKTNSFPLSPAHRNKFEMCIIVPASEDLQRCVSGCPYVLPMTSSSRSQKSTTDGP